MSARDSGSPDPVSEPQAYQQHLLGLLGDDDPAVVQAATPAALRGLIDEAGDDLGRHRSRANGRCSGASRTSPTPSWS